MYDEVIKTHESLHWMENTVSKRSTGETSQHETLVTSHSVVMEESAKFWSLTKSSLS